MSDNNSEDRSRIFVSSRSAIFHTRNLHRITHLEQNSHRCTKKISCVQTKTRMNCLPWNFIERNATVRCLRSFSSWSCFEGKRLEIEWLNVPRGRPHDTLLCDDKFLIFTLIIYGFPSAKETQILSAVLIARLLEPLRWYQCSIGRFWEGHS